MDNTQNLGQPVGKVTTTYNGEKIQVNVYADRSVILPDGTVRKVKQEVVDALIAKNQAMNPASTIVRMAPAKPRMTQPEPSQEQVQQPAARVQEPAQPSYQPQMQMPAQPQQPVMPQNAAVPEMQYQNEPVQQGYDALQKDDGTVVWGSAELIVYTCLGDAYNVRVACFNRA